MSLILNQLGLFAITRAVTFFLSLYFFSLLLETEETNSFIGFSLYALMPIFYLTYKTACSSACKFQDIDSLKSKVILFKKFDYSLNTLRFLFTFLFLCYCFSKNINLFFSIFTSTFVYFISFDFDILRSFFKKQIVFQYLMGLGFIFSIIFLEFLSDFFTSYISIGYIYAIAVCLYFLPLVVFNIFFLIKIKYHFFKLRLNKLYLYTFLACLVEPAAFASPFYLIESNALKDYAIIHRIVFATLLFTPLIRSWIDGGYVKNVLRRSPLFYGITTLIAAQIIVFPYYFLLIQMNVEASISHLEVFLLVLMLHVAYVIFNVVLKYYSFPSIAAYLPLIVAMNSLIFFNKDNISIIYVSLIIATTVMFISLIQLSKESILHRL